MELIAVAEVQRRILRDGLTWLAAETEPSRRRCTAAPGAQSEFLGLSTDPEALRTAKATAQWAHRWIEDQVVPNACDWRDRRGGHWLSPVGDQWPCNTCVAFAALAAFEARLRIAAFDPHLAIDLSEAEFFKTGGGECEVGWNFDPALKHLRDVGAVPERLSPYADHHDRDDSAVTAERRRILAYTTLDKRQARKRAIASDGPALTGMIVYEDFLYYSGGVYSPVSDVRLGTHAVAVVGFDDSERCWTVQNSWGSDWGEGGFARIAYESCGIESAFVLYDFQVA